ncbi:MAG: nuclear transport factor 2 family protein [Anaerolineae bacterium]|nr:nuclear transport factor 2 family protein [Anaerolineae bacterium]
MTPDSIQRLIGGYLAAWNEPDAMARQQFLREVWTDGGRYTDPQSDGEGRDALDRIIARLHRGVPGVQFSLDGAVDHHHTVVRFAWMMKQPNGSVLHGMDFGDIADDGRLNRIVGFF